MENISRLSVIPESGDFPDPMGQTAATGDALALPAPGEVCLVNPDMDLDAPAPAGALIPARGGDIPGKQDPTPPPVILLGPPAPALAGPREAQVPLLGDGADRARAGGSRGSTAMEVAVVQHQGEDPHLQDQVDL